MTARDYWFPTEPDPSDEDGDGYDPGDARSERVPPREKIMTSDDPPVRLVNPYLTAAGRPAVWGVTLGRVGIAAAGVLAVAGAPDGALPGWDASTEVVLGAAADVDVEVRAMCMPGGYLWPGEPPAEDTPVSPALA